MSDSLPAGFVEISPDRSVTTEELLQLNAVAIEQGHTVAINERLAEEHLAAGQRHNGTTILFTDDAVEPAEEHGGMRTHPDAWLIVAWILELSNGTRAPALMGCRAGAWIGLDPGEIFEGERLDIHRGSLGQLGKMVAKGLLIPNRAGEMTPLLVPEDPA